MKLARQIVKRLSLIIALLLVIILATVLSFLVTFFYNPTIFINPKNVNWALEKTNVLKSWSWETAVINHEWIQWNKRRFTGRFNNLCFVYDNVDVNVDTCMERVSWNVELNWGFKSGFKYDISDPLIIDSSKLLVKIKDNPEESPPPDILSYWDILWSDIVPDMQMNFRKIEVISSSKPIVFDLVLSKDPKNLKVFAMGFNLHAVKERIDIFAPKQVLLPYDLKTKKPLYFSEIKLAALMNEKDIPVTLTANIETAILKIDTKISKAALKEDLSKINFLKQVLLNTRGSIEVAKLRSTVRELVRPPFNILPAPINAMEGSLKFIISTDNFTNNESVLFNVKTELDMSGPNQELKLALNSDVPFNLRSKTIGSVRVGIDLQKVNLLLPKFSRTRLPPQLIPDSRFKNSINIVHTNLNKDIVVVKKKNPKKSHAKKVDVSLKFQALDENALQINTNLLDEVLKLNFDLDIAGGEIVSGYIHSLPFRTTIFKRKIYVQSVRIIFNAPLEPEIIANIQFELPEYHITLELEGPLSKPRQAFSSKPALPLDDIYAVLLFGRPLDGLDPDDKTAAKKANQILSQGILSLGVLYYFAGSPVESIGYDPESNELSASVGLGSKNSLRVGGSGSGLNSAGIRRSLGKGWYIDSSVQKTTTTNGSSTGDYGVLLERIISY